MIQRFCGREGCPNLVIPPARYCPEHKPQVTHETSHHNPFYSTARWQRFRNWYIGQNPLCEQCGAVGDVVDHIKELKDGGAEVDPGNAQTLCNRCHVRKTRAERKKRGPVVYNY